LSTTFDVMTNNSDTAITGQVPAFLISHINTAIYSRPQVFTEDHLFADAGAHSQFLRSMLPKASKMM